MNRPVFPHLGDTEADREYLLEITYLPLGTLHMFSLTRAGTGARDRPNNPTGS